MLGFAQELVASRTDGAQVASEPRPVALLADLVREKPPNVENRLDALILDFEMDGLKSTRRSSRYATHAVPRSLRAPAPPTTHRNRTPLKPVSLRATSLGFMAPPGLLRLQRVCRLRSLSGSLRSST